MRGGSGTSFQVLIITSHAAYHANFIMKRIIICCDGTWNKPGSMDLGKLVKTNVQKIYEATANKGTDGIQQVKYYGQGVGTGYSILDKFFGGATGKGIDRNIKDAYKFIMWNYEPGDELYFFGFSRGAYTARSLVGLIRNCGVMKADYLNLVDEAYALYRDRNAITHPDSDLMMAFKTRYSQITRIKFVGVWDTVGALGIPIQFFTFFNKEYQFHDVKLSSDVDYAYHAVALDEKRRLFQPTLWEMSRSAMNDRIEQHFEQVWFPGVHSNVGGGYADTGLSDVALEWMIQKAQDAGLGFRENYLKEKVKPDTKGIIRDSVTGMYFFLPRKIREVNKPEKARYVDDYTEKVIEYDVVRNEKIHYSCFERSGIVEKYKPVNLTKAMDLKTPLFPDLVNWRNEWKKYIPKVFRKLYSDTFVHGDMKKEFELWEKEEENIQPQKSVGE
jgi:uncharacterized protein (DUF2235 family)